MQIIPFNREANIPAGVLEPVAPGLRRILASNAGPFTFNGTNTYVIGEGNVAVVDPGPDNAAHRSALLHALGNERISHIVLTHAHPDHSAGIPALKAGTGAATYGFGRTGGAPTATLSGKDLIDTEFTPDVLVRHGETLTLGGVDVEVLHTPGHAPDHICLSLKRAQVLLSGDHVMGWNTSIVAPPEGNMAHYIAGLEMLLNRDEVLYFPGHGGRIDQPQRLVKAFIVHRRWREDQIVQAMRDGLNTPDLIAARIYEGLESRLLGAASLSVSAHIELLIEKGRVESQGPAGPAETFRLVEA